MIEVTHYEEVTCAKGMLSALGMDWVVYVFLVDGLLIDTGSKSLEKYLIPFYQSMDIDSVVLTHTHEDHIGTSSWIQKQLSIPIYVHTLSVDFCSEAGNYPGYREEVWGTREGFASLPAPDLVHSRNHSWKILETPGHAEDHIVLLNEETGRLFSGDLFLSPKPKVMMSHESIPTIMRSIELVLSHDFQGMYCCHAGYLPDGRNMMRMKLDYLQNLSGEVLHLHKQGYSIQEIDKKLFPHKFPITFISNNQFDSEHLVRSIIEEM